MDPEKSVAGADVMPQPANCCEEFQMGHALFDCYGFLVVSRLMVIGEWRNRCACLFHGIWTPEYALGLILLVFSF